MPSSDTLFLSFYGDDFTGSTDVMESLTAQGIPAALFLAPPSKKEVDAFRLMHPSDGQDGRLRAFGVPGIGRSLSPEEMDQSLPPIFEAIAQIPSTFFHYKTCSTFDSSPEIGNIAKAADLALNSFPSKFVPLLVGAPALGRYCVFGNLFAQVGEETFRLDRHPTMSQHPITPMKESDLRRHIASLGTRPCKSIDILVLQSDLARRQSALKQAVDEADCPFVLFDTLDQDSQFNAGELLYRSAQSRHQLVVGSSGVEYSLCNYLQSIGKAAPSADFSSPGPASLIIAISGSAAPASALQIEHAIGVGFADIRIRTMDLLDQDSRENEIARVLAAAGKAINAGRSPMIYAARGPRDPAIRETKEIARSKGERPGPLVAQAQGKILRRLLEQFGKQRVVVAGGDTTGYAAQALGLHALEMRLPIAPGAPLCLAHSREEAFHGLEISLKGGQNGNPRYFESVLRGKTL